MPATLNEIVVSLTYPPYLSLAVAALALAAMLVRRPAWAGALLLLACGWTVLWSIPQCSDWLRASLEERHPAVGAAALPMADAIVVLGGGDYSWVRRGDVQLDDLRHSRLAAGTRAWLAGRAPRIILSGGGGPPGNSESHMMARAIRTLGVPASALLLETRSRDTRGNARHTAELAASHGIHRVLLVTSALHMPRASHWFRQAGLDVVPVPVPETRPRPGWKQRWLPSRGALRRSGRAWKEYAGLAAAHVQAATARPAATDAGRT